MKKAIVLSCLALLVLGSVSQAGTQRPYMGVRLDPAPLPELLTKHLGLDAGQGIRISNVNVGSPADRAGLERDDIIVAFQDEEVTSLEEFVDAVRNAGVETEVSLEVIHLGQSKTLQFELGPMPKDVEWEYPPEPEVVTSWQPGKFFKIGPEGQEWVEIPLDRMPEFDLDVKKFFKETYTYHHSTDSEQYTITIEGNPNDEDTEVIVQAGDAEYRASVNEIDSLPEKYRGPARKAVEDARKAFRTRTRFRHTLRLPEPPRPDFYQYFRAIPRLDMERWSEQKDQAFDKLQEQIEHLQKRMKELEEHNREMLDKLLEKWDTRKDKGEKPENPAPPEPGSEQAI